MKELISAKQFLAAIVLVPLGSAVLFFITPNARQDSWIVILVYMLPAVILQVIYTGLWKRYPEDTIITYMPKIFGKLIGHTLSILYIAFFLYIAARVLRDFSELVLLAIMPKQSLVLVSIIITSTIGYSLYLGFEAICRTTYTFLFLWLIFSIMIWIFLSIQPDVLKLFNLKPILENGLSNLTKNNWKLIAFPYGESVLFTMFFPYVVEKTKVRKAAIMGTILLGLLLSIHTILFISVLGADFACRSLIPMVNVLRIITIGSTFDRVDIFLMLIIVIIGFVKISFFAYGSMIGAAQLLKLKSTRNLVIPFSIIILIASLLIASNYPEHVHTGLTKIPPFIHIPLEVVIPITALLVFYTKKLIQKSNS